MMHDKTCSLIDFCVFLLESCSVLYHTFWRSLATQGFQSNRQTKTNLRKTQRQWKHSDGWFVFASRDKIEQCDSNPIHFWSLASSGPHPFLIAAHGEGVWKRCKNEDILQRRAVQVWQGRWCSLRCYFSGTGKIRPTRTRLKHSCSQFGFMRVTVCLLFGW